MLYVFLSSLLTLNYLNLNSLPITEGSSPMSMLLIILPTTLSGFFAMLKNLVLEEIPSAGSIHPNVLPFLKAFYMGFKSVGSIHVINLITSGMFIINVVVSYWNQGMTKIVVMVM